MKNIVIDIICKKIGTTPFTLYEIIGLGVVNRVFSVKIKNKEYIIRVNEDKGKVIEYKKGSRSGCTKMSHDQHGLIINKDIK